MCSGQAYAASRTVTRTLPRNVGGLVSFGPFHESLLVPPKAIHRDVEVIMRSFDAQGAAPTSPRRQSDQSTGAVHVHLPESLIPMGPVVSLLPDDLAFVGEALPLLKLLYNETAFKENVASGRTLMAHVLNASGSWEPVQGSIIDRQPGVVMAPVRRFSSYVVMSVVESHVANNASATTQVLGNAVEASSDSGISISPLAIFVSGVGAIAVCWAIFFICISQKDQAALLRDKTQAEKTAGSERVFSDTAPARESREPVLIGQDNRVEELEAQSVHLRQSLAQQEAQVQAVVQSPGPDRHEQNQLAQGPAAAEASRSHPISSHEPPSSELVVIDHKDMSVTALPEPRRPIPLMGPPAASEPTSTLCILLELTAPHQGLHFDL